MRYDRFFLLIVLLCLVASAAFSQYPELSPDYVPHLADASKPDFSADLFRVNDITGVLKNKVVSLPKPVYPAEAKGAEAEGAVRVQISIDEEGNVTSASAVSGHPSFKAVCEEVAGRSRFIIFRVDGVPQKTTGVLVYHFEIKKAGWAQIGANISGFSDHGYVSFTPIFKAFDPEWTEERALLESMAEARKKQESIEWVTPPPKLERTVTSINSSKVIIAGKPLKIPSTPTPEEVASVNKLADMLRKRLSKDDISLWRFNVGFEIGTMAGISRNRRFYGVVLDSLKGLVKGAPSAAPPEMVADLKALVARLDSGPQSENDSGYWIGVIKRIVSN